MRTWNIGWVLMVVTSAWSVQARGELPSLIPHLPLMDTDGRGAQHFGRAMIPIHADFVPFRPAAARLDPELVAISDLLTQRVQSSFASALDPLNRPQTDCSAPAATADYAEALRTAGEFSLCRTVALLCRPSAPPTSPAVRGAMQRALITGASCAQALQDFPSAYQIYSYASDPIFAGSWHVPAAAFFFAEFALFSQYENEVQRILTRNPAWARNPAPVAGLIEYFRSGSAPGFSAKEMDALLAGLLKESDSLLNAGLHVRWAKNLYRNRSKSLETLRYLKTNLPDSQPEAWTEIAFKSLYHQVHPNWQLSRKFYHAARVFAHSGLSLPLEENVTDYTAIFEKDCVGGTTWNTPAHAALNGYKSRWLSGMDTSAQTRQLLESLDQKNPARADLLSMLGGVYEALGDDTAAEAAYWKAHQACAYYNRSHWGMTGVSLRKRNLGYSDSVTLLDQFEETVAKIALPTGIDGYVSNWNSLTAKEQKHLRYALRPWLPYVAWLASRGNQVYIKRGFQLLSESPNLAQIRDTRIQMPGYETDNRLWDDVRGLGGSTVVVDLSEMMEAPLGAYNLAGHEVAHQFHGNLPPAGKECLAKLYAAADSRKVFPDSYAAVNDSEYFAQGIHYSMIPESSPKRFGINAGWLVKNDPDLLEFIGRIERANGDVSKIACPI